MSRFDLIERKGNSGNVGVVLQSSSNRRTIKARNPGPRQRSRRLQDHGRRLVLMPVVLPVGQAIAEFAGRSHVYSRLSWGPARPATESSVSDIFEGRQNKNQATGHQRETGDRSHSANDSIGQRDKTNCDLCS